MEFPDREMAEAWVGRTLVDLDGVEIGACTEVLFDDATHVTEWVRCEVAGSAVFIPAVGAAESDDRVQVGVRRDDVAKAPPVGDAQHISAEDEATLYRHYGMPHSRDESPTLLPTGQGDRPESDPGPVSDAGTERGPESEGGVGGRIVRAAAALAGVAVAVAAAVRMRRRRRRPLTRRERLVRRGRAASGAMAARAGRIARRR